MNLLGFFLALVGFILYVHLAYLPTAGILSIDGVETILEKGDSILFLVMQSIRWLPLKLPQF
ncbi:hypothetical protein ACI2OX_14410 [Bacillus sp. N9]